MAFLATELSDKINGYLSEMPYMREPKGLYAPIEYVVIVGWKADSSCLDVACL